MIRADIITAMIGLFFLYIAGSLYVNAKSVFYPVNSELVLKVGDCITTIGPMEKVLPGYPEPNRYFHKVVAITKDGVFTTQGDTESKRFYSAPAVNTYARKPDLYQRVACPTWPDTYLDLKQ